MRINVYAEELTNELVITSKTVDEGTEMERTFYGLRWFQKSSDALHYSPEDDDRQAITFWIPWSKKSGHDAEWLAAVLYEGATMLREIEGDL